MEKPSTSFVSLLNGIGIVSSGLLGALYALAQKEKSAAVATIETVSFYELDDFRKLIRHVLVFEECLSST